MMVQIAHVETKTRCKSEVEATLEDYAKAAMAILVFSN